MELLIKQFDNVFELKSSSTSLSAKWFMTFGKQEMEVFQEKQLRYSIVRRFTFWKWKLRYTIKDLKGNTFVLENSNRDHSIYEVKMGEVSYQIKMHPLMMKSFFKNGKQIAFSEETRLDKGKGTYLWMNHDENIEILFLLSVCFKIGETNESLIKYNLGHSGKTESRDKDWIATS